MYADPTKFSFTAKILKNNKSSEVAKAALKESGGQIGESREGENRAGSGG